MYTEYIFENREYDVALRDVKSILFDIVMTEQAKVTAIISKVRTTGDTNLQEKLISLCNEQAECLRSLLDISNSFRENLQLLDSYSRELKRIENKNIANIITGMRNKNKKGPQAQPTQEEMIAQQQMAEEQQRALQEAQQQMAAVVQQGMGQQMPPQAQPQPAQQRQMPPRNPQENQAPQQPVNQPMERAPQMPPQAQPQQPQEAQPAGEAPKSVPLTDEQAADVAKLGLKMPEGLSSGGKIQFKSSVSMEEVEANAEKEAPAQEEANAEQQQAQEAQPAGEAPKSVPLTDEQAADVAKLGLKMPEGLSSGGKIQFKSSVSMEEVEANAEKEAPAQEEANAEQAPAEGQTQASAQAPAENEEEAKQEEPTVKAVEEAAEEPKEEQAPAEEKSEEATEELKEETSEEIKPEAPADEAKQEESTEEVKEEPKEENSAVLVKIPTINTAEDKEENKEEQTEEPKVETTEELKEESSDEKKQETPTEEVKQEETSEEENKEEQAPAEETKTEIPLKFKKENEAEAKAILTSGKQNSKLRESLATQEALLNAKKFFEEGVEETKTEEAAATSQVVSIPHIQSEQSLTPDPQQGMIPQVAQPQAVTPVDAIAQVVQPVEAVANQMVQPIAMPATQAPQPGLPNQQQAPAPNLEQQLMTNGLLPNDANNTQAIINQKMEQAKQLYAAGRAQEAQAIYNEISELSKAVQQPQQVLAV